MATLENLEDRTLLSNVTTAIVSHVLYITTSSLPSNLAPPPGTPGTPQSVSFSITENNATGQITLVGTKAPNANPHLPPSNTTQINGNPVGLSWTSTQAIQSLYITLPGDHTITDYLTITSTGPGKGTLQSVVIVAPGVPTPSSATSPDEGLNLTLGVTLLTVSGGFSLYDAPTTTATGATPAFPVTPTAGPSPVSTAPNAPAGYVFPTTGNPAVPSNNLGGNLTASVTYSSLGSLYVEQDGCCQASVTLDHDAVAGALTVEEGVYNGDSISLTNSTAGATTLIQGYGPIMAGCNGTGDLVNVQDDGTATTGIFDLAITQLGLGGGEQILVGTVSPVEVGLTGFGIYATQDDGYGNNTIHIESITVYGHLTNGFGRYGPPSIVTSQGNGYSDATIIDSSTVWGNISASQGNGSSDSVYLGADSAGSTAPAWIPGLTGSPQPGPQPHVLVPSYGKVTVSQGSGGNDTILLSSAGSEYNALNVFNNLVITQGLKGGDNDTTIVDSTVVVTGNIIVVQGDGAYDAVYVTASTAGYTTMGSGGNLDDHGGLLAIIQGNGYADLVEITSSGYEGDFGSVFNNVFILQGTSSPAPAGCSEDVGDTVIIDQTTINSNLFIFQNAALALGTGPMTVASLSSPSFDMEDPPVVIDGKGLGYNAVLIGTGMALPPTYAPGSIPGLPGLPGFTPVYSPGEVYVGGETYIYQGGTGNTDLLGGQDFGGPYADLPADFETGTLDIWTGAGGAGNVTAANTVVIFGSYLGNDYVINGGGAGNTYVGNGGNSDNGFGDLVYGPGYSG